MRRFLMTSLLALLLVPQALAQENQEPSETAKPKNEVERMLEDAKKRGEIILAACVAGDCGEDSSQHKDDVEKGRALHLGKPTYSNIARMGNAQGEVKVQVIIDEEGKVAAAAAISGHPLLYGPSVAAARESTFTPTRFNGKPVKVVGVIRYNFVTQ